MAIVSKSRGGGEPVLLAFTVPILLFGVMTAPYLVFAIARFGKLLIVPVLLYVSQQPRLRFISALLPPITVLSCLSNFAFTYYQTDFYGEP